MHSQPREDSVPWRRRAPCPVAPREDDHKEELTTTTLVSAGVLVSGQQCSVIYTRSMFGHGSPHQMGHKRSTTLSRGISRSSPWHEYPLEEHKLPTAPQRNPYM
ncbi:hypothetical protein BDA96_05G000800 [Sorghum bicolor]|uniref:Uncharacterized protein n=1 Tax=Sorghum bicolor TaxID=4558 RepID=A0A921QUW6_SORBI|nr:hypothetical protein BDA96_05G000800 [Sorghum bicolor]